MIRIHINFDFKTKSEWKKFGDVISNEKDILEHMPILRYIMNKDNSTFNDVIENAYTNYYGQDSMSAYTTIITQSKSLLKKINTLIKENHFENKYYIANPNYFHMTIDELMESESKKDK